MVDFEQIPFIIISPSSLKTIMKMVFVAGRAGFLLKPNSFEHIVDLIRV